MLRADLPVVMEGFFVMLPLKFIIRVRVSWLGGMKSMVRSSMNTKCWIWRSLVLVFCFAGLRYKHGLA